MKSPKFLIFQSLFYVAFSVVAEQNFPPNLSDQARVAFNEKYEPAARYKAFAVTGDGARFYYVSGQRTSEFAARSASLRCLSAHGELCFVWKINGDDVLGDYARATEKSKAAISVLPINLPKKVYAAEDSDMGVVTPQILRDGAETHGATPALNGPAGSRLISTLELVKLFAAEPKLVVIDTNIVQAAKKEALPKANWLNGAGWVDENSNKKIDKNLSMVMSKIAPNKDTPIVSYCANWECWLSWNTTVRLSTLGYTNLYWYRGGIDAWKAANLPVVETPITAQLY